MVSVLVDDARLALQMGSLTLWSSRLDVDLGRGNRSAGPDELALDGSGAGLLGLRAGLEDRGDGQDGRGGKGGEPAEADRLGTLGRELHRVLDPCARRVGPLRGTSAACPPGAEVGFMRITTLHDGREARGTGRRGRFARPIPALGQLTPSGRIFRRRAVEVETGRRLGGSGYGVGSGGAKSGRPQPCREPPPASCRRSRRRASTSASEPGAKEAGMSSVAWSSEARHQIILK